jgi:hypothetical protein
MAWIKQHFLGLFFGGLFVWWLMTGDTPVVDLVAHLVGRGRQLTSPTLDGNGDVIETIDELSAQAAAVMGRDIATDAIYLGTVSGSEHPTAGRREKATIQRVCMNDAEAHSWSIAFTVTNNKGLGKQAGRRYSSRRAMYEIDLLIAESNLAGTEPNETGGATHFVHITGFANFGAYQELCSRWYDSSKIVPVKLDGIPSFRIFLPESQVASA